MEERQRAHDLFPAINLRALFLKRASRNEDWSLFSPTQTKHMDDLYGDEWATEYIKLEQNKEI